MLEGQPFALAVALCHQAPRGRCEIGVGLGFARAAIDLDGGSVAPRQFEGDDGASVANHRAAHQPAQALRIGRLARLAWGHIGKAEFLQCLENARLQQRQEIVELDQIVLHWRRRQQEQETLVERIDEFPTLTRSVAVDGAPRQR